MKTKTIEIPRIVYLNGTVNLATEKDGDEELYVVTVSNELPVKRFFGDLIVGHGPGELDLTPLMTSGSVLYDHDSNQVIGVPTRAEIMGNNLMAWFRFASTPLAQEKKQLVKEGILRGISPGLMIEEMLEVSKGVYRSIKASVREISITPIPANHTATFAEQMNLHSVPIRPRSEADARSGIIIHGYKAKGVR
jgi:HK97 family phage prohead protease